MTSRFVTKKRLLPLMWRNTNFSLIFAFVRNDPHTTRSTAGWRLIIFPSPVACQLASPHGEHPTPRRTILALALAPWPAQRALKVEKIESVSRVAPPSPRGRAGDVKPALRQSHRVVLEETKFSRSHTFTP